MKIKAAGLFNNFYAEVFQKADSNIKRRNGFTEHH